MRIRLLALAPIAAVMLASCAKEEELYVDKSWVTLPAVGGNPAAAYFTIHGGPADDALISVTTDTAIRTEMHESMSHGGMMTMQPLSNVPVPAKSTVEFKPGGKHVMFFELRSTAKPGGALRMVLTFQRGDRLIVDAPIYAAGQGPKDQDKP
ncbi:copper chaperone PCu(A)C [Sphingobium boeckii]|uniref:Copper chaperone PCu(A)C n=1 Tax=Sphingobium boeckii TaxID=1082345 RepID=A0A7W9AK20_9SPHN|nr:copper chaperone PCu(A)C [Sphingobium boeckii]MBB5686998.1 hypothetical protein [Sphingobium boeckii]